jgi:outer membrane receptor for ferrienterochelin and colicins
MNTGKKPPDFYYHTIKSSAMKWLLPTLLTVASYNCFAQPGALSGKVIDKQTNEVLPGATVGLTSSSYFVIADKNGEFSISQLEGTVILIITYVGYEDLRIPVTITANKTTFIVASLVLDERKGSEAVVTVSRHPEKITNAPASIQVIGVKDFEQTASYNVHEMLSKVQGIEYTRYGIDGITFNARGLNSAFNNKVLQLVDGRNSMAALSANLPIYSLNSGTYIKEDLERIEIVLGPQTALYGPNAHNAVLNFISKDPRKYAGTSLATSIGNHYQFSARLRHATMINKKWSYKLTGEYSTGREFIFYDSVHAGGGNFGPAVNIPEHRVDFNYRHLRGEAHLYYSITPKTDLVLSGGGSNNNTLQVTTTGRNQMRGVTYGFVQAKLLSPHIYASIYNTWGNLGNSYVIANYSTNFWNLTHRQPTPMPPDSAEAAALVQFKEASRRFNAEVQYNYHFQKQGLFLVAGANYQRENPNGFGINLIDNYERISIMQYGGALQLEKIFPLSLKAIAAIRFDHHSGFGNFFAPKFALTKEVGKTSFRISWAKAYAMPSIQQQYAGIGRVYFGNGGSGIKYIPNNARVNDPAMVKNTTPLIPEEVNTWELGYKGNATKKLFFDINYYNGSNKNFVGPILNVAGRAISVNGISVTPAIPGIVDSNGILHNARFVANFNYGKVRSYGIDAGLNYQFSKIINLALKYSWFNSDITKGSPDNDANKDGVVSATEKSLNTPKNRYVAIVSFQNLCKEKLYINFSVRYIQQYDFYSGNQNGTKDGEGKWGVNFDWGPLGGFTSFDVNTGFQISKEVSVGLVVANLFNTKQLEMVGSPSIGRLIIAEVRVNVSGRKI